jgi:anti-sigma factor ChrR (cupin superfamily)
VTNSFSPQEQAAAYALDILEEQAEFERELAKSTTLQSELAAFQTAVHDLAYGVPAAPLPVDLKKKLFDRLINTPDQVDERIADSPANLLDLLDWPITDLQQVAIDLPNWQPFPMPSGSEMAIWQVDEVRAQVAFFLRAPTAGMLPNHYHATGESILVLEGNFIDEDGTVYEVGDRFVATADTSHQPSTSLGCLILNVTSIHDKILVDA